MASSGNNGDANKEFEAELRDVGNKLYATPSCIYELLTLLVKAEKLLYYVPQNPQGSMQTAIYPSYRALITDAILKHQDPDVQLLVASCINEMVRISSPLMTYKEDRMKEIFQLFMVAYKHLSCECNRHNIRAMLVLECMAQVRSCIVMLDLELDQMIIEMFQIFLDTIKPNHSMMFDYMKTIMILIIEESDEISVELLRPLLSSLRKNNNNTSPRALELVKAVFESCTAKLQGYVREAVKSMNLDVDDYVEIVASLCQDTPNGRDMVANEEVQEVASIQLANEEIEQVTTVQVVTADASGDGVFKMDKRPQAAPHTQIQVQRSRRRIKPNTLMRPDEGYYYNYKDNNGKHNCLLPSELRNAKMASESSQKEMEKPEKVKQSEVEKKGSKKGKKTANGGVRSSTVGAEMDQKREKNSHESTVVQKVIESPISKPAKAKPSKIEEKCTNKRKRKIRGAVVPSSSVGKEKDKVSYSVADLDGQDVNKITSQNHEPGDVAYEVVESPQSRPAKSKKSDVKEKGSYKRKRTTKSVVLSSALGAEKGKLSYSAIDPETKDNNEITSKEHEKFDSADVVDKVVESPMSKLATAECPGDLDPEKEEEPMDFRLEYGLELVNVRIMVWWPLDKVYYTGTVESYDPVTKNHKVKYDDGDEEILDMSKELWQLIDERQCRQAQSCHEQEADPSPVKEACNRAQKKTKRKEVPSKKEHAGPSSKRSNGEGRSILKSGHSASEFIPVNVDSDDESCEANFSWKAKAMNRLGKKGSKTG